MSCCCKKSRDVEEGRKKGCLQCCMFSEGTSKETDKKGRGKWSLLACLRCRGNKVTCCFCKEPLGSEEKEHKSLRAKKIKCGFCSCCSKKPSDGEENKSSRPRKGSCWGNKNPSEPKEKETRVKRGTHTESKNPSEPGEKENQEKRETVHNKRKHSEQEEKEKKSCCVSWCGRKSSKHKEKENKSCCFSNCGRKSSEPKENKSCCFSCCSKKPSEPKEKENKPCCFSCCNKKSSEPKKKENKLCCFSCCNKKSSERKEKENKSGRARKVMHSSSFYNRKPSEPQEKNSNLPVKPMETNEELKEEIQAVEVKEEIQVVEVKEEIQVVEVKEEIRVNTSPDEKKKQKRLKKEGKRRSPLSCLMCGRKGCCCTKPSGNDINKESGNERNAGEKKKKKAACSLCKGNGLRRCFCCVKSSKENKKPSKKNKEPRRGSQLAFLVHNISFKSNGSKHRNAAEEILRIGNGNIAARTFLFQELSVATKNFKAECLLGEGGFGRVYKGKIADTGQIVAVKQLDRNGFQGNREFLIEVLMLSLLHHPNLVKLLGYCADGDQRILVYEYMPLGSLEDQLFAPTLDKKALDWNTRMKIALGSAKGLEYLHDVANPPVIYRDFKASNILLDEEYNSKLSDFGLAKLGPMGDKSHVSTRVMGTYGYCAPEYAMTGKLTKMSDVYSFGVVFLEMITGRRAIDISRPPNEQQLINWAGPLFRDKSKFVEMADPVLQGRYPLKGLYQALAVASMCLQDEANIRPRISDVVTALEYLVLSSDDPTLAPKESTSLKVATPGLVLEENVDGIDNTEEIQQSPPNREDEICET